MIAYSLEQRNRLEKDWSRTLSYPVHPVCFEVQTYTSGSSGLLPTRQKPPNRPIDFQPFLPFRPFWNGVPTFRVLLIRRGT